ncbi:MAG: T9SS type A sorting domain-containing protein [Olleya sp.]
MKTKLLYILVVLPMFLLTNSAFSQTTLAPGNIVIFQAQGDDPDSFAFVTFVNIDAGTGIYFTDCGTTAAGEFNNPCTEGARKYTVPAGGLSAGDIIKFTGTVGDFAVYSDSRITGNFLFSTGGDQVVAFQDATSPAGGTNAGNNPSFIYILNYASTTFAGNPVDSNETSLPPSLSVPTSALALGAGAGNDVEWDNVIYNGTYDFSGFATEAQALAAAKAAFENPSNYLQDDLANSGPYIAAEAAIPSALMLNTLSTEEFGLDTALSLYPNPSNGNITIKNSGIALDKVEISDLNGRVVFNQDLNGIKEDKELNLSSKLSSGMYLMTLTSNNASTVKKLIIE